MAAEPMTKSRASASLGGALRAESSEGVLRVIFSGEWKRDLLGPNFFTERDEALRETERLLKEARSVELLGEALGEWDSGVLVGTTRLVTLAKEHNIPLDDARLPEGIRNLTKLALAVPPNTAAQATRSSLWGRLCQNSRVNRMTKMGAVNWSTMALAAVVILLAMANRVLVRKMHRVPTRTQRFIRRGCRMAAR